MTSTPHGLDALSQKKVPVEPDVYPSQPGEPDPTTWQPVCDTIGLAPGMSGSYSVEMARMVWFDVTVPYSYCSGSGVAVPPSCPGTSAADCG